MIDSVEKPLIIAHRGSSTVAPENTIAAFARAVSDGSEGIEFDVRLTKDGVPVVFHDSSLLRIAGSDVRVSSVRLSEIVKVDAGSWFNKLYPEHACDAYEKERIPTLESVMKFLKDFTGSIYIELKSSAQDATRMAVAVGEILARYSGDLKVIVKSFEFNAVSKVAAFCPGVETAALFAPKIMHFLQKENLLIRMAKEMNFDRLSLHFSLASRKLMEMAGSEHLPVTIWTADNPRWIKKGISLGIDSIITNNPYGQLRVREKALAGG